MPEEPLSAGELREAIAGTPYETQEARDESDMASVRDALLAVAESPEHAALILGRVMRSIHAGDVWYVDTHRQDDDVDLLHRTAQAALADLAQAYSRTDATFGDEQKEAA